MIKAVQTSRRDAVYRLKKRTWKDIEAACNNPAFFTLDQYDCFPTLDYDAWMAYFRNNALAAFALVYPGVLLLAEEHELAVGAVAAIVTHLNTTEAPIRLWYHPRGDEVRLAAACGYHLFDKPPFDDDFHTVAIAPDVSEIEVHRLLKQYELGQVNEG